MINGIIRLSPVPDGSEPKMTKTLRRIVDSDSRIVAVTVEADGVFIYTDSSKWCDCHGSGTFRGDNATQAIKRFRSQVRSAV